MDKSLYEAARKGNVDAIGGCSNHQLDTELTPNKNTVLHVAAQFGRDQVAATILEKSSRLVLSTNSKGETALHIAARDGYNTVVRALLDYAKKLDQEPESGGGATKELLRAINEDGNTALHLAVGSWRRYGSVEVVRMLVEEDKEFQHPPNKADETPLYIATENENDEFVTEILDNCTLPGYGGPGGRTALHSAAIFSTDGKILELLLKRQYLVDLIKVGDDYGWTPLHYASRRGITVPVELLLKADKSAAYVAAEKDSNNTPLLLASTAGNVEVMEKLLLWCPDCWEMVNCKGQNILHIAVEMEHEKVIDFICEQTGLLRFLLNQKDEKGNTPIHLIAASRDKIKGNWYCLRLFSEATFNNDNMNPDDVANIAEVGHPFRPSAARELEYFGWRNVITGDRENILKWKSSQQNSIFETKEKVHERMEKVRQTHLIVVALVATVTFAAGFTLPGGFDDSEGPNQGLAILGKKVVFKAFIITNTVAVMSSISSIFLYFTATMRYDPEEDLDKWVTQHTSAYLLAILAMIAMTIAFITGSYAVLAHSLSLAISMCVLGCFPFFLYFKDRKNILYFPLREMVTYMQSKFRPSRVDPWK